MSDSAHFNTIIIFIILGVVVGITGMVIADDPIWLLSIPFYMCGLTSAVTLSRWIWHEIASGFFSTWPGGGAVFKTHDGCIFNFIFFLLEFFLWCFIFGIAFGLGVSTIISIYRIVYYKQNDEIWYPHSIDPWY